MDFSSGELREIWENVKQSMIDNDTLPPSTCDLWFGDIEIVDFTGDEITFSSPQQSKYTIIAKKYVDMMENAFERVLGFHLKVNVIYGPKNDAAPIINLQSDEKEKKNEKTEAPLTSTSKKSADRERTYGSTLPVVNFEYTFDNFIEGTSNTFARACCWAVAETAARAENGATASQYNPLFIYGPSGIGKTHLMYAITSKIKEENPDAKIIYIKGEDFTNQLVDSLSRQAMNEFREEYRQCDLLMIDDIQFIAGKTSTQEEFFHTFDALYNNSKQIILSSDRPPKEINPLEQRLKSRFEMGLLADIQPPDLELRIAIIKKKAEQGKLELTDDVLTYLAENLRSNIRQIEGAINKLCAMSFLSQVKITRETVKSLLSDILGNSEPISVTIDKIFASVYNKFGVKREEIVGLKRTKEIANARHIAVYLVRNITEMSLPNIGKIFNRDHSTIMSSIETVQKKLATDTKLSFIISEIEKEVG